MTSPHLSRFDSIRDTAAYLNEHAKTDFRHMPEGTISNVLNRASPEVRQALSSHYLAAQNLIESGGRLMPFEQKLDVHLPDGMAKTYQRAEDEQTYVGLNERMGTAEQSQRIIDETPVSLRDIVSASMDHHEGSTQD